MFIRNRGLFDRCPREGWRGVRAIGRRSWDLYLCFNSIRLGGGRKYSWLDGWVGIQRLLFFVSCVSFPPLAFELLNHLDCWLNLDGLKRFDGIWDLMNEKI